MKMDYLIAIPSYKRAEVLRDNTLALLQKYHITPNRIFVFVANEEERKIYERTLIKGTYGSLNVGLVGLRAIRNFIQNFFDEGVKLVCFDDDVSAIKQRLNDYECRELVDLNSFIVEAFKLCEKSKANLWGVYPMVNPMFMHNDITFDLQFIIGSFFGMINTHDPETMVTMDSKDDYERTIKFYIRDGKVIRFNGVGVEHDFNKLKGGVQAIMTSEEREKKNIAEAMELVNKYPMFCSFNKARKGRTEIRLFDKRKTKRGA